VQTYEITLRRERRARLRFPVNIELRYQTRVRGNGQPIRGTGLTRNMSSKALVFRPDRPLAPGTQISVSMGQVAPCESSGSQPLGPVPFHSDLFLVVESGRDLVQQD
jgi:hypothetical protein